MNTLVTYNLLIFFTFYYLAENPRVETTQRFFSNVMFVFNGLRNGIICLGSKWTGHKATRNCPLIVGNDKNCHRIFQTHTVYKVITIVHNMVSVAKRENVWWQKATPTGIFLFYGGCVGWQGIPSKPFRNVLIPSVLKRYFIKCKIFSLIMCYYCQKEITSWFTFSRLIVSLIWKRKHVRQ